VSRGPFRNSAILETRSYADLFPHYFGFHFLLVAIIYVPNMAYYYSISTLYAPLKIVINSFLLRFGLEAH
jgi:hypothetical protein